ncbi:arginine--tRNA ligase [Patescibacteria group bacterium]|nr:arginine--tRNA ligase [Patescibacteria group bacterium]MBU2579625.1 arginine--tRNA ligase [Patescibacteria group bacterium]
MIEDMIRDEVKKIIEGVVGGEAFLERPGNSDFGDYSTNVALRMKVDARKIVAKLEVHPAFEKVEVAGPGFINFTLSKKILLDELAEIIKKGARYGEIGVGKGEKVQVEFVSANPTGPLTVANGRGGPFGDVLAGVLSKSGFNVERAYYVNDHGMQIEALGHSVLKDSEAVYKGGYIDELNKKNKGKDAREAGKAAAKYIIENLIRKTTDKLGIKYDEWALESEIYQSGLVDEVLDFLEKKGFFYEKDGARWFKSSELGDTRDRVLVKKDGNKTYLAGDIAFHWRKFNEKKFTRVINVWGADHHGDVAGLAAGVEAIGHKGKLETVLLQFVTILEKGEKKRMSKRAGVYVEMDELIEKVGADATRFFFLQKSPDTHLNFDMDLAREQSNKNPVFYVQYAHARICGILAKSGTVPDFRGLSLMKLTHLEELNLIRHLIKFPEIVEDIAKDYQVQRLPQYSMELANAFHRFYEKCRVLDDENKELSQARICLVKATKIVLKNTLDLMGIKAPEKM